MPPSDSLAADAVSGLMADLGIEVVRRGTELRLVLTGDLDISAYERVAAELRRLEDERPRVLVIDLGGLAFMDSTGARFLVEADGRARAGIAACSSWRALRDRGG